MMVSSETEQQNAREKALATGNTVLTSIAIDALDNSQAVAFDSQLSLTGTASRPFLV